MNREKINSGQWLLLSLFYFIFPTEEEEDVEFTAASEQYPIDYSQEVFNIQWRQSHK